MAPFIMFSAGAIVSLVGAWLAYIVSMHKSDLEYRLRKLEELFLLCDAVIRMRLDDHVLRISMEKVDDYILTHYVAEDEAKSKMGMIANLYFRQLIPAMLTYVKAVQASRIACLDVLAEKRAGGDGRALNDVVFAKRKEMDGPYDTLMLQIVETSKRS